MFENDRGRSEYLDYLKTIKRRSKTCQENFRDFLSLGTKDIRWGVYSFSFYLFFNTTSTIFHDTDNILLFPLPRVKIKVKNQIRVITNRLI